MQGNTLFGRLFWLLLAVMLISPIQSVSLGDVSQASNDADWLILPDGSQAWPVLERESLVSVAGPNGALALGKVLTKPLPADPVSPELKEWLESGEGEGPNRFDDGRLRIIVGWREWPVGMEQNTGDRFLRHSMESLEIEVIAGGEGFPTYLVGAKAEQISLLASLPSIVYIGADRNIVLMMGTSTAAIDGPSNWNGEVVAPSGERRTGGWDNQGATFGIDGRGVTVVVSDTGIDGGHPDFDWKEKLLTNLWKDCDACPWIEHKNTDTSYGHGTHCAGTIAGNGDASGGLKRGVAPAANLIGVGGDWTPTYWAIVEGLMWTYNHSKPGNNPDNIRAVSNSWGDPDGREWETEHPLSHLIIRLTYENNIAVMFAAGNEGENNHGGETITTNVWANVPASVSVAAAMHDGDGMAYFSSRGQQSLPQTWPDIAAPGVNIDATAARATLIQAMTTQRGQTDPYYYKISGTSMATPHVSGVVALLWQAAPTLRLSNIPEDGPVPYSSKDADPWYDEMTFIHETELILKLTAERMPRIEYSAPDDNGYNDNGVPVEGDSKITHIEKRFDRAQGFGLVNITRALAVAHTLQQLRDPDQNGVVDDDKISVMDAYKASFNIPKVESVKLATDVLDTRWRGEWTQFTNRSNPADSITSDQRRVVTIPQEANGALEMSMTWNMVQLEEMTVGTLDLLYSLDRGDTWDVCEGGSAMQGWRSCTLSLGSMDGIGEVWVDVRGTGFNVIPVWNPQDVEFGEARVEYRITLLLEGEFTGEGEWVSLEDFSNYSQHARWAAAPPSDDYSRQGGFVTQRLVQDLRRSEYLMDTYSKESEEANHLYGLLLLLLLVIFSVWLFIKTTHFDEEIKGFETDEVIDAVIEEGNADERPTYDTESG